MPVETDILPERYRSPQRIGRGGMGEIYRVTDSTLGRAVAVKILSTRYAEDEAVRQRFTREALAAARLSGEPNTVTIFDVGEWNERPFIVMEYLSGGSLDDRLRAEGAQPPARALQWLEQAATALDAAHRNGVVHRDVKPGNLLLDRDGNVHVCDFGIASAAGMDSMTMTGTIMGTAGYLSPEQANGERATSASDGYALAIVAFELLTGERPFQSESVTAEATAHVHAEVPSVCDRLSSLPCELDPVFQRALAKDPNARYPTCADFVADLRHQLNEAAGSTRIIEPEAPPPAEARLPAPPTYVWPERRAHRGGLPLGWLLAALFLLLGGGGVAAGFLLSGGRHHTASPTPGRSVVTVAARGTTARETVTTAPAPTSSQAAVTSGPPPSGSGHSLNDKGYALMQGGDYQGALPYLQQSVKQLQGVGPSDPYEGYANYNLGYTLVQLGKCAEGLKYLQRADKLEPGNSQVHSALGKAQQCK